MHFLSKNVTNTLVPKLSGFVKNFVFAFSAPPISVGETLHVAYKNYKIKRKFTFFFGKYQIYFIECVENIRIFTSAMHS